MEVHDSKLSEFFEKHEGRLKTANWIRIVTICLRKSCDYFKEFPERIFLPRACEGRNPTVGGR